MVVDDLMTREPKAVSENTMATAAMALLEKYSIAALLVVDSERRPMGIVHFRDL